MTSRSSPRGTVWAVVRGLAGASVILVVVWRLGAGPFLQGLRAVDGASVLAAMGIGFLTTTAAAWRWSLVARGLGVALPLRTATAACYRSQLLNSLLPGGVLGDVDRAVRHGREAGHVGRGVRAVAWERTAGQGVQLVLGVVVLLLLPSLVPAWLPFAVLGALLVVGGAGVLLARRPPRPGARGARVRRALAGDLREGLLARRAWPGVAVASVVVVGGHLTTLLVAARTAGSVTPVVALLPLAMIVLQATAVPTNVGGWGPREGVAAWAFGAAGLGAAAGVATTTVYAVLSLAALSPGAPLLLFAWLRSRPGSAEARPAPVPVEVGDRG